MWATEAEEKRKILSFFPCLTPDEFEHGARTVVQGVESGEASQSQDEKSLWRLETSVKDELPYVVVKRPLWSLDEEVQGLETSAHRVNLAGHEEADELNEMHDGEMLVSSGKATKPFVEYQVHYHRTYEVPALYFFLRDLPHDQGLPTLEQAYECLVPGSWRGTMEKVGVLGAISMTDHPVTGEPCFFVHPCNTADAMAELGGGDRAVDPEMYLRLWVGVVGAPVGFHLPLETG